MKIFFLICATASVNISAYGGEFCDSLQQIDFYFTRQTTKVWIWKSIVSNRYLEMRFQNGVLDSWINSSGVDLVKSRIITPSGCRAIFPAGDTCTMAMWDSQSPCYVPGMSVTGDPVIAITGFGGRSDVGLVFFEHRQGGPIRQLLIFRPSLGPLYLRQISPLEGFVTKDEQFLDSVYILSGQAKRIHVPRDQMIISSVNKAIPWVQKLRQQDIHRGKLGFITWKEVATKASRPASDE